jgi:hypothetical protein
LIQKVELRVEMRRTIPILAVSLSDHASRGTRKAADHTAMTASHNVAEVIVGKRHTILQGSLGRMPQTAAMKAAKKFHLAADFLIRANPVRL